MTVTRRAGVAALTLGIGMAVVGVAPAHAAAGWNRCPSGAFCLFSGRDGTGTIGIFRIGSTDLRLQGLNNNVRSVWNRGSRTAAGYDGFSYTGENLWFRPAFSDGWNFATDAGLRTSSARFI